ncbi:MAG: exosortase system-associated protein, TIGR04073 family [Candidatus Omnitrophota bacterium]
MKKFLTVFFVAIMVLSFSVTVFAADMPKGTTAQKSTASAQKSTATVQKSTVGTYDTSSGPVEKFDRGVRNTASGFLEVPKRVVEKVQEYGNNPIKGVLLGLFQGSCKAFAKTASGIVDIVTCPVGQYDTPAVLPDMPAAK